MERERNVNAEFVQTLAAPFKALTATQSWKVLEDFLIVGKIQLFISVAVTGQEYDKFVVAAYILNLNVEKFIYLSLVKHRFFDIFGELLHFFLDVVLH